MWVIGTHTNNGDHIVLGAAETQELARARALRNVNRDLLAAGMQKVWIEDYSMDGADLEVALPLQTWDHLIGYHALEDMRVLELHVTTDDLN
jgi:hypothetical protein